MDAGDELYSLPAAEFTAARDALARRLRADGRREDAEAVKKLRRPTAAAAALNRAVRARPEALEELLCAGRNLTRAQERLVAGHGDRSVLREASEHVREATSALAALAAEQERLSPGSEDRVRATLHAALVDATVREALSAGRLEREAEPGGGLGGASSELAAPRPERRAAAPSVRAARQAEDARRRAAGERLAEASREARDIERKLGRAAKRAERTAAAVDTQRERLAAAEREAAEAEKEAAALQAALRRAKGEAAAAQAEVEEAG